MLAKGAALVDFDFSELMRSKKSTERNSPAFFEVISSAKLDQMDVTIEYLVDQCIVKGQPCIVAGPQKSLKTSILVDFAISLATGKPFLGHLKVKQPCRVLMMSAESGLATLKETAQRVAASKGEALAGCHNLFWSDRAPQLNNDRHGDALRNVLDMHEIDVLVIDPAYLCMPSADAGNLMAQGEILRRVNELCQEVGATLLLCHHTRKNGKHDPWGPPDLGDIAWAGFQEWARQWILVNRRERYREGSGRHHLWLSTGGSAGHSALWGVDVVETSVDADDAIVGPPRRVWQVQVTEGDETLRQQQAAKQARSQQRQRDRDEQALDKVMNVLRRHPDGASLHTLKDQAGHGGAVLNRALEALKDAGRVESFKVTVNGRSVTRYRLAAVTGEANAECRTPAPAHATNCVALAGLAGEASTLVADSYQISAAF